jgi:multimeric flavodoxin WrbA
VGDLPRLVVVHHSRTGSTMQLCQAALDAATAAVGAEVAIEVASAFDTGPEDVTGCQGLLLATPARFGYMSGALKDFFERVYHPCMDVTAGLAYALIVKGDTDVDGAVASVERIATGLRWRRVLAPLTVVGAVEPHHLEEAAELGATFAAGIAAGIF